MRRRRHHAVLLGAFLVLAGVTCNDRSPTGPSSGLLGRLGLAPALSDAASEIYRDLVTFGLELDNLRLQLKRQGGEIVKDTVLSLTADQDEIRIELIVPLRSVEERLLAIVQLRTGEVVLFSGSQEIVVRPGQTAHQPPPVSLNYVGPDASATSLTVSPSVVSLFTSDSVDFAASALDANQQPVPLIAIAWLVKDATLGVVSATGRFKPAQIRGETFVVAKLPTGLKDSARVSIVPLPTQIAVISGGGQSGLVGTLLGEPIVVELRAADNQPVPGFQVDFAVVSGGGSLSVLRAVTDASGRASTTLTLGILPGPNVISISAPGIAPITVTATATTGLPAILGSVSPNLLSITDSAGALVATTLLPAVAVTDAFGNELSGVGVTFRRLADGSLNEQPSAEVTVFTGADGIAALTSRALRTQVGGDTVIAKIAGVTDSVTFVASVTNATASLLSFAQQPLNGTGGTLLSTITVELRDRYGNLAMVGPSSTLPVALSLNGVTDAVLGPDPAALTQSAVAGVASFNVWVDKAATGYTLTASAGPTVAAVASAAFDIAVGPIAQLLAVSGNLQGSLQNSLLQNPLVVRAVDAGLNPVGGATVVFDVVSGGGTLTGGVTSFPVVTDANGLATAAWTVGTGEQRVSATSNALTANLQAFVAEKVVLLTEPSLDPRSGVRLDRQPSVRLQDNAGNPVKLANVEIATRLLRVPDTGSVRGGIGGAQSAVTNADGVAAFANMNIFGPINEPVQVRFSRTLGDSIPDPAIAPSLSGQVDLRFGLPTQIAAADQITDRRSMALLQNPVPFSVSDGYNAVPGAPVVFSALTPNCSFTAGNGSATTDAAGSVTMLVDVGQQLTSCKVAARVDMLVQPEGGGDPFFPESHQRLFAASTGTAVWRGGSTDWNRANSWLDGVIPTGDAFIPVVVGPDFPNVATPTGLQSLFVETDANVDVPSVLTLSGNLSGDIIGTGTVALITTTSVQIKGSVQGLLKFGEGSCSGADYDVVGALSAGNVEVNCNVDLRNAVNISVLGDLTVRSDAGRWRQRAGLTTAGRDIRIELGALEVRDVGSLSAQGSLVIAPSAGFDQNGGTVAIAGDATFDGASNLTSGVLEVRKNFNHTNAGSQPFAASGLHTTRMTGDASVSQLSINWDAASGSSFGRLDIIAPGSAGVAFSSSVLTTVPVADLWVHAGAKLTIPALFTINAGGTTGSGVHLISGGIIDNTLGVLTVVGRSPIDCTLQGLLTTAFECLSP